MGMDRQEPMVGWLSNDVELFLEMQPCRALSGVNDWVLLLPCRCGFSVGPSATVYCHFPKFDFMRWKVTIREP